MIPDFVDITSTEEDRLRSKQYFINNAKFIDPDKKTFLFIVPDDDGTCHFRILEPLRAIARLYPDKYNLIFSQGLSIPQTIKPDVVILHRPETRALPVITAIKETLPKCKFVFDMDDNIYLKEDHHVYHIWQSLKLSEISESLARMADCIFTSTPTLKKVFARLNKNVVVVSNGFDFRLPQWNLKQDWLSEKNAEGKIVIGWAGGSSHLKDQEAMSKFLRIIHDQHKNTHFVIGGVPTVDHFVQIIYDPVTKKDRHVTTEAPEHIKYKNVLGGFFSKFDKDRIDFINTMGLSEYGKCYSMMNINLAYTEDTQFNRCKSDIKVIEGLAYGAIPLFSYMGGYKDYFDSLVDKDYGIMVINSVEQTWARKLSDIITNYDRYKKLAARLKESALDTHSVDRKAKERIELFEKLMK